ncbi:hypothetical protein ACFV2X_47905 [Streptomyces sp. NPDC059679]|uniref:hypothetical protein n=1 Tax=Streptomyces sp. NPDC059679 TaxID=3346903 RepID=UPI0036B195E3
MHFRTNLPKLHARLRATANLERSRPLQRLQTATVTRFHAAGGGVLLAEFGTGGLAKFIRQDALQVVLLFIGLVIVISARKKDMPGAVTIGGIALMGLAVMGLSGSGFNIGEYLGGWIWTDPKDEDR